jgi:hypothetical protein
MLLTFFIIYYHFSQYLFSLYTYTIIFIKLLFFILIKLSHFYVTYHLYVPQVRFCYVSNLKIKYL